MVKLPEKFLVFDVESVGLHGEGFAVGYVIIDQSGAELESGLAMCPDMAASGTPADRDWIRRNIRHALDQKVEPPPTRMIAYYEEPIEVRNFFWGVWVHDCRDAGTWVLADCPWPVEARFLNDCVDDYPLARNQFGPYPIIDITTLVFANRKRSTFILWAADK